MGPKLYSEITSLQQIAKFQNHMPDKGVLGGSETLLSSAVIIQQSTRPSYGVPWCAGDITLAGKKGST